MDKETPDYKLVQKALHIIADLLGRFFINKAVLFKESNKLVIFTSEDENEILSFIQRMQYSQKPHVQLEILKNEDTSINNTIKNGLILYGNSHILLDRQKLKEMLLIEFDTSKLVNKDKIRFYQKLYGYEKKNIGRNSGKDKSTQNNKKSNKQESYQYKGFLENIGGKRVGKSAIMVDKLNKSNAIEFFGLFDIELEITKIYLNLENENENN